MATQGLAFKDWATTEGCLKDSDTAELKAKHIAIDAEEYLFALLAARNREPLLPALGGLPLGLKERVEKDIAAFREGECTPLFVFNGLDVACNDRASILKESKKAASWLGEAWAVYDQGKGEAAVEAFGKACTYRTYHIIRAFQLHLHSLGVYVQVAPYTAAAQMKHMLDTNWVNALCGSASCLVYGAERVIFNIDWDAKKFFWATTEAVLQRTGLNKTQFIDLCLLSGSSILPMIPILEADAPLSKMQAARALLGRSNNDGTAVCHSIKDDHYYDLYQKAIFAVKHPVIMKAEDGACEPVNWKEGPGDAHEFISQRLPDEIYYYMSRCLIGPRVLNWRVRMEALELPPLDGGSSQAYKDLVKDKLRPLRTEALALVTDQLHRYYQKQDVNQICWWNEEDKTPLNVPSKTEGTKAADKWHVRGEALGSFGNDSVGSSPFSRAITQLSSDDVAKKTVTPREKPSILRELKELHANTLWRFLENRGYINSDHTLAAWGKALRTAFDAAAANGGHKSTATQTEMEESIFMAFELLRLGVLNNKNMFPIPPYAGAPLRGSDTDKANTLIISRVACLGTFSHQAIGYTGPLSRHLLAYQQMTASVRGALRDLVEMHACYMHTSGAVDRTLDSKVYTDLSASLPFGTEPDLGLAIVVKSHLDELSNDSAKRPDIRKWFNHAEDIAGDLEKAWKMWGAVNAGVQAADSGIVDSETRKMFKGADDWLAQKLSEPAATNGTS